MRVVSIRRGMVIDAGRGQTVPVVQRKAALDIAVALSNTASLPVFHEDRGVGSAEEVAGLADAVLFEREDSVAGGHRCGLLTEVPRVQGHVVVRADQVGEAQNEIAQLFA